MDLTNASAIVTGGRGDFARWPNFLEPPQSEAPRTLLPGSSEEQTRVWQSSAFPEQGSF